MNIYSFEFATKEVTWYTNEFKDMRFIGTESRRFISNRNFLRIDDARLSAKDVTIEPGTFFKPAITIPGFHGRVIDHIENLNCSLMYDANMEREHALAFITIDSQCYRLVDYTITTNSETPVSHAKLPEIRKVANHEDVNVALVQFDIKQNPEQVMILVLYNRFHRKYEYYQIYPVGDGLVCENATNEIGKKVMEGWKELDRERRFRTKRFELIMNEPVTKYYITDKTHYDELVNILKPNMNILHAVIIEIDDSMDTGIVTDVVNEAKESSKRVNAITFYKVKPRDLRNAGITFNFIMEETGIIMT